MPVSPEGPEPIAPAPAAPAVGAPPAPPILDASGRPWPAFAHGSEAEMARILDFYAVAWEYEPRTFPILWNLDGDVVESFSPDFYLPELDVFLELTTLKQRLVRKKNRKLRRLRELYPDIRIKLFYARDFRAIMLKYGRLAFADAMSGTIGQVMPDRPEAEPVDEPMEPLLVPAVAVAGADVPISSVDAAASPTGPEESRPSARARRRRAARAAARAAREAEATTSATRSRAR